MIVLYYIGLKKQNLPLEQGRMLYEFQKKCYCLSQFYFSYDIYKFLHLSGFSSLKAYCYTCSNLGKVYNIDTWSYRG